MIKEALVQKYCPKSTKELVGQKEALAAISKYLTNYPKVFKKALLLYGPTGVGKTSLVKAIATEKDFELIEVNAADCRSADSLNAKLLPAATQRSLWGNKKILLIDELEGLHGQSDRGGVQALVNIIKQSAFPIVITSLDPFDDRFKTLRLSCELVELKPLDTKEIVSKLKEIAEKEKINYDLQALQTIALHANGDLRAAINDLQMLAEQDNCVTKEKVQLWGREQREDMFSLLRFVFKSFDSKILLQTFDYIDNELEDLIFWIEQNLFQEFGRDSSALVDAYQALSLADGYLQKIKRRQHWRFFLYAKYFALVGVQQAKKSVFSKPIKYTKSDILLKIYMLAAKRKKAQSMAEQYSEYFHTSSKRLMETFLPYYNFVSTRNQIFGSFDTEL
jgi:replication factor C large subunit